MPVPSIPGPHSRGKCPFPVFERGGTCSCPLQMKPLVFMRMSVAVSVAMRLIVSSTKSHCQLVSWHENYSVVTFCATA